MRLWILVLFCPAVRGLAIGMLRRAPDSAVYRVLSSCRALPCTMCDVLPEDDLEGLPDIGNCEGRIVTELKAVDGELPDRFMMAVQAIRGDFSPPEDHPDDERQEDLILQALTNFPATVNLKVVSRAGPEEELDRRDTIAALAP